eukprot:jgi/Mesen1/5099/ME000253S04217
MRYGGCQVVDMESTPYGSSPDQAGASADSTMAPVDPPPLSPSISLGAMSKALPETGSGYRENPIPMYADSWNPERAAGSDPHSSARHDWSAEEPMQEEPPSVPGSPSYPDMARVGGGHAHGHVAPYAELSPSREQLPPQQQPQPPHNLPSSSATTTGTYTTTHSRSFQRANSFDSTAATIGSPHPSHSALEAPYPPEAPQALRMQALLVMRHSERLDNADAAWAAAAARPWDPPITERGRGMAFEMGRRIRSEGYGVTRVVCSPFLRCVQTAAEVIRALAAVEASPGGGGGSGGVGQVAIDPTQIKVSLDYGLCEMMTPRAIVNHPQKMQELRGGDPNSTVPPQWVLPRTDLEALFPPGTLDPSAPPTATQLPNFPEGNEEAHARYARTFDAIADIFPSENVLCLTHGEGVMVSVTRLIPVTVYDVAYNAYSCAQRPIYSIPGDDGGLARMGGDWELLTESSPDHISWLL